MCWFRKQRRKKHKSEDKFPIKEVIQAVQPVTKSKEKSSYRKNTTQQQRKNIQNANQPCQPHRLHVKRIHTLSSFQRWGRFSFQSHRKCPMSTHRHRMALFTQQHLEVWNFYLLLSYWKFHSHFIIIVPFFDDCTKLKTQWESWKMWICRKRNKEMKAAHGVFFSRMWICAEHE